MRTIRIALWAVVALVAVGVGALAFNATRGPQTVAGVADIGGPFTLTDQHDRTGLFGNERPPAAVRRRPSARHRASAAARAPSTHAA